MTVQQLLARAFNDLPFSSTPRLDFEVLLCHVVQIDKAALYANLQLELTEAQWNLFQKLLNERQKGSPIAYLVGHKEFWSIDLAVSMKVLIPRPETELLIETILARYSSEQAIHLADLGTGSGAIVLALAMERPHWQFTATDISFEALTAAKNNSSRLKVDHIFFNQGSWCSALSRRDFNIIVSNPPYLSEKEWELGPSELKFEPKRALVADENGLKDISEIITQSKGYLKRSGCLVLEHGYQQGGIVRKLLISNDYHSVFTQTDLNGQERVTVGYR